MPILLSNGTSVLSGPTPAIEAVVAAYCNSNSIFTNAALRTQVDTIATAGSNGNTGINATFMSFMRQWLKDSFQIIP
jgi:hypothetical protein